MPTNKKITSKPKGKEVKKKVGANPKKVGKTTGKQGRPVLYNSRVNKIVYKLALLGVKKNRQIADSLGISEDTFYDWLKKYKSFSEALKKGREDADSAVAESVFKNATGYTLTETDIRVVNGEIVKTNIKKNYPPNAVSGIFWLKNRQPDLWKDKQEVLNSGEIGVNVQEVTQKLDSLSDAEKLTYLTLQKKLRK